jgi:tRNA(Arg) A34 adenosine deaminase TadA
MARSAALTRRHLLASVAGSGAVLVCHSAVPFPASAASGGATIIQPDPANPAAFMARAFAMKRRAEAEGDQSYGAVVVLDGRIASEAPSAVVTKTDPTAHAEMQAIRDAARRIGRTSLAGADLYSSSRPCPMCEAAAFRAGIRRMIHGIALNDAGPPRAAVSGP